MTIYGDDEYTCMENLMLAQADLLGVGNQTAVSPLQLIEEHVLSMRLTQGYSLRTHVWRCLGYNLQLQPSAWLQAQLSAAADTSMHDTRRGMHRPDSETDQCLTQCHLVPVRCLLLPVIGAPVQAHLLTVS